MVHKPTYFRAAPKAKIPRGSRSYVFPFFHLFSTFVFLAQFHRLASSTFVPFTMSLRHLLRSQRVLQQQRPWVRPAPFKQQLLKPASLRRPFHTTRPQQSPLIPLPAMIISALKTGKLVSLVSFSSKTSLTLLPHTLYNQKTRTYMKFLAGIPVIGLSLLVLVGLDQVRKMRHDLQKECAIFIYS